MMQVPMCKQGWLPQTLVSQKSPAQPFSQVHPTAFAAHCPCTHGLSVAQTSTEQVAPLHPMRQSHLYIPPWSGMHAP